MALIEDTINKYLPMFDTEDDLYKWLISDNTATIPTIVTNYTEYDNGAVAGLLRWNRDLVNTLERQISLLTAESDYIDLIGLGGYGLPRYEGETEEEYVDRLRHYVIGYKQSKASIINYMRRYSPGGEPELLDSDLTASYADYTYASVYTIGLVDGSGDIVFPAVSIDGDELAFYFVLQLYSTADEDIPKVLEALKYYVAAGIGYDINIT